LRSVPARHYFEAFIIIFIVAALAFSTRWVFGKKMIFEVTWDPIFIQHFYPNYKIEAAAFKDHKIALWQPYVGFGLSLALPVFTALPHPLVVMMLLWGTDTGMEVHLLLRLVLAGFFSYMLGRGLGLSHRASLLAGLGFMLCGFFREYLTMLDILSFMFLPLFLLFLIRLFRQLRLFDLVITIWTGFIITTGGHPEAVYYPFALVVFAAVYGVLEKTLAGEEKFLPAILSRGSLMLILIAGYHIFFWGLVTLITSAARGWSFHTAAIGKAHLDINQSIAALTPVFDYWLSRPGKLDPSLSQFTVIPAYLGFVLGSLALLSIFNLNKLSRSVCFFWILALIPLGIAFGIPGFNIVSLIPVLNRLQHFRYSQVLIALSASILAGFGFDRLHDSRNKKIYFAILAALAVWLAFHFVRFSHFLLKNPLFLLTSILLIIFLATLALYYFFRPHSRIFSPAMNSIIFAASTAELFSYFVFLTPFYGAEAFQVKRPAFFDSAKIDSEFYRLYSPDQNILTPNMASLFGIRDLRAKITMYSQDHFLFLSALNGWTTKEQAAREFLKDGKWYLPLRMERIPAAVQDLLFGYLAVPNRLGTQDLSERFNRGKLIAPDANYFARGNFQSAGKSRPAFLIHPPARLSAAQRLEATELEFEIGLLPKPDSQSDGADFFALGSERGRSRLLFARFLSYAESRKRGWIRYHLDLNSRQKLSLATLPGPKGNPAQDYALFSGPWIPSEAENSEYLLVSDAGPFLYRRVSAAARFFFAQTVEWAESQEKALELVRAGRISAHQVTLLGQNTVLDNNPSGHDDSLKPGLSVVRDDTDLIELSLTRPDAAWLLLLDEYDPGWKALLDGKETRIYRANYLFRAVFVPAGRHSLKFIYRPLNFEIEVYAGLAFFAFGISLVLLLLVRKRWRVRSIFPGRRTRD